MTLREIASWTYGSSTADELHDQPRYLTHDVAAMYALTIFPKAPRLSAAESVAVAWAVAPAALELLAEAAPLAGPQAVKP